MKAVLIVLAVVGVIGVGAVVTGWLLPQDHVVAMSVRIAAPPDSVWAVIANPAGFPAWRPEVTQVDMLAPGTAGGAGPAWREHTTDGVMKYVIDSANPPRQLVTRIADRNLPFGGQWDYRIEPEDSTRTATMVTITERGSVYNPVYRFASRFVMGQTSTIDRYLRALGRRFGTESAPVQLESAGAL